MRLATVRATRLIVTALSLTTLAACATAPVTFGTPGAGDVEIEVVDYTCSVTTTPAEYAVIDWPTSHGGQPLKVKFKVKKAKKQDVFVVAAAGETQPLLFGPLPKFTRFATYEEKDAKPLFEPNWTNGTYAIFKYKVIVDGVTCDPEICIRQNGSGCIPAVINP